MPDYGHILLEQSHGERIARLTLTSLDHAEGAAATREGRTPQYEGR